METTVVSPSSDLPVQVGAWLAGRSPATRRIYASGLDRIARSLDREAAAIDWGHLEPAAVEHARERMLESGAAPATVNTSLSALRSLVQHLWRAGIVSDELRARLQDVGGARGSRLPAGRHVEPAELLALSKACAIDGSLVAQRDVALLALAATTGLRRAEIVGLDLADVDLGTGRMLVRGKGNRERAAFVTNGALDALRDWIAARGAEPGPLFVRLRRRRGQPHNVSRDRLTTQSVLDILSRRAREAGLDGMRPHDLRRTVAGELLDQGVDISTVARLLGHADVRTTARYDRRPEAAVATAGAKLRFPYRRSRV